MLECKFYMRNGTVIKVGCKEVTVRVNQITRRSGTFRSQHHNDLYQTFRRRTETAD
ncbi:MAG: hypothetical protein V3G42_12745 [Oscillospiraceae bacterium]